MEIQMKTKKKLKTKLVKVTYCYQCGIRRDFLEPNSTCAYDTFKWSKQHRFATRIKKITL